MWADLSEVLATHFLLRISDPGVTKALKNPHLLPEAHLPCLVLFWALWHTLLCGYLRYYYEMATPVGKTHHSITFQLSQHCTAYSDSLETMTEEVTAQRTDLVYQI